ncbi:hypothetical protein N8G13_01700 [Mycoplasma zalophi]|uniref:hypothetical protein n=1 Tax=Mycoplasma zalophi TaxID=191287 RepID=UPI0021C5688E|nr:hypothetical protein [Mycoplasma zalophi]MCU4117169.1 hypothetical protein [Mycoplasma zalophi]
MKKVIRYLINFYFILELIIQWRRTTFNRFFNSGLSSFKTSVQDTQDDNFIQFHHGILKQLKNNYEKYQ